MKHLSLLLIGIGLIAMLSHCTKEKVKVEEPTKPVPVEYCDSLKSIAEISYSCEIERIVQLSCGINDNSCHGSASGRSPLNTYTAIKKVSDNGAFIARAVDGNLSFMPPSGPLPDSTRAKIESWVNAGAKDN